MRKEVFPRWHIAELPFSTLVLFILALFTYGVLFKAPYSGFNFNNNTGQVVEIYTPPEQGPSLQAGDVLIQIGNVLWTAYKKDATLPFFENVKKGEIVEIVLKRKGVEMTIPWKIPGFNQTEFNARVFNIWGLAYIFWFSGTAVYLFIRPKDLRWKLFIAANYLTGLWLIFGCLSAWHLWGSSILLHTVTWLLLPVYLHLHWIFPRPLKELPKAVWILVYLGGLVFAAMEITQSLPKSWYALAFVAALFGSFILEIAHFIWQADQRRDVIMLSASIFIAFAPSVILGIIVIIGATPYLGPAALFALPFMPLAYFYVIYRRQLGGLEIRINRFISLYAFLILFGTALLILVIPVTSLNINPEIWIFLVVLFILFTAYITIALFPRFQAFVEKRLLGIKLPYQNLLETYSSRITTSTSLPSLLQLLDEEIFPSLLIRQFAFIHAFNGSLKALLVKNVSAHALPIEDRDNDLVARSGRYIPTFSSADEWMRLILPLKVGDETIGFWLLGRRDPDDLYSQAEISILQTLANQTAIALSNILQTERLKATYQDDINQYENERTALALTLHDDILNQLAVLSMSLGDEKMPPAFQEAYKKLTTQLREIIVDLRPPMLNYGLALALQELADNLMERSKDTVNILVNIETDNTRYHVNNMEEHIFRMVQETCENALRHAQAKTIHISGRLVASEISLTVTDDGIGFDIKDGLEVNTLVKHKHFGLAGIQKRAELINAEVAISSDLQKGTSIQIISRPNGLISN